MIPRLKPELGFAEIAAALHLPRSDDVINYETEFAELMQQSFALAFPYGRTGLLLLLEALEFKNREIICPAYTCVVVPHAIVLSGNKPVFVDCAENEFNMDLEQAEAAITEKTAAIIATSLFGYPVNLDALAAIKKRHPKIDIIQDCAHSFGAEWSGRPVQKEGVAAIFGLNISKILTSVFGGMVTTDSPELFEKLKRLRQEKLLPVNWLKGFRRLLYLLATNVAFWQPVYGFINALERSGALDYFVRYYDDAEIDMPPDYLKKMCALEARVGSTYLRRYPDLIQKRRAAAQFYQENLGDIKNIRLPKLVEGVTYSHYVVRVQMRDYWLDACIRKGVQLGWLIEYNIPEMPSYGAHAPEEFPIAADYARTTVNLPVWGGEKLAEKVTRTMKQIT